MVSVPSLLLLLPFSMAPLPSILLFMLPVLQSSNIQFPEGTTSFQPSPGLSAPACQPFSLSPLLEPLNSSHLFLAWQHVFAACQNRQGTLVKIYTIKDGSHRIQGQVLLSQHTQILRLDPCLEHKVQLIISPFKNPAISTSAIGYYNNIHHANSLYSGSLKEEVIDKICMKKGNILIIPKIPKQLINCILTNGDYNKSEDKDATSKIVATVKNVARCTHDSLTIIENPGTLATLTNVSTNTENPNILTPVSKNPRSVSTTSENPSSVLTISENPSSVPTIRENPSSVSTISENPSSVPTISEKPTNVSTITENPATVTPTLQTDNNVSSKRSPESSVKLSLALGLPLTFVLLLTISGLLSLGWRRRTRQNQRRGKTGCL